MKKTSLLLFAIIAVSQVLGDENDTTNALTKAALYIFDRDYAQQPADSIFTPQELELLGTQRENLVSLVNRALTEGDSVVGADLIGHFGLEESAPALRSRFLKPGTAYLWEKSSEAIQLGFLADEQYVYHRRYYDALLALYGPDLASALDLSQAEKISILQLSQHPSGRHYHWSRWMRGKLEF